jgi:hypothetical protein
VLLSTNPRITFSPCTRQAQGGDHRGVLDNLPVQDQRHQVIPLQSALLELS